MLDKKQKQKKEKTKSTQHYTSLDPCGPVMAPGIGKEIMGNAASNDDKSLKPHADINKNRYDKQPDHICPALSE